MNIGVTGDIFLYSNKSEMRELCVMLGTLNPSLLWASGARMEDKEVVDAVIPDCPGVIHVGWENGDLDRAYWRDDDYDGLYNQYRHELSIEPRVFSIDDIRSMYNDDPSGYDETPMTASELFGMAVG